MNEKLFCIECKRYFQNKEDWDKEHDKIFYQLKNIKHNYIFEGNVFSLVFDVMSKNYENEQRINKQEAEIANIKTKLNFYEDSLKNDVFFETNINIKHSENKISGKCLVHFFPKAVNFKIECNGNITFSGRKEFEIEILFPFKTSKSKFCSIEKLQGCLSSKTVQNTSEEETTIFSNYSPIVLQTNKIVSLKLLRNYSLEENLKKNKIDVSLNGILTFSNYGFNVKEPFVLYNILQKSYLSYEKYQWKFIENCFEKEGKIKKECFIELELDFEAGELYIKNQFNYLGISGNFSTKEKKNAKFHFQFINSFYGVITIVCDNKYLNADDKTGEIKLSEKANFFMIINV